jgi:murein DD-endopeptidase MepM/ murein hydrolase activator NlpD
VPLSGPSAITRVAMRDAAPPPPVPQPVRRPSETVAPPSAAEARLVVQPSFEEVLAFPPDELRSATYRFRLRRGDTLKVEVRHQRGLQALITDIYEIDDTGASHQVFRSAEGDDRFEFVAWGDAEHILRLQPPAGVSGRYVVRVEGSHAATLRYPVAGMSPGSIAGMYGDARDGGARDHKGVDIFAPRNTPVLAVADGVITAVETTGAGGRSIWQRDDANGLMYFYAHLEAFRTTEGRQVSAGDTIGLVGNSGNARGSSTHLHFGVFLPGYQADDPVPYLLGGVGGVMTTDSASVPAELGRRVRLESDRVRLRSSPSEAAPVLEQLSAGTDLLVLGYLNGWTRVVLSDGRAGFVAGWLIRS